MTSGVVPVVWNNYGVNEYATNKKDSIIFDSNTPPETVANTIFNLLNDKSELDKIKEGINVTQFRDNAVANFINILENGLDLRVDKKKIVVVTPHLRKWGGPSTILHTANGLAKSGHDVSIYSVYPDINPSVSGISKVPIHLDHENIGECDVLISNSDNPQNPVFVKNKKAKKKIMLKLSHNPRFKELENNSLKLDWDSIITSTDWLVGACANPKISDGWDHPAKEATRVGWFHYEHFRFDCSPYNRTYGAGTPQTPINICMLAHHHPSKGTPESIEALEHIKMAYGSKVNVGAVGEWAEFNNIKPSWVQYFYGLKRYQLADLIRQSDIWLLTSHTEGLGRLALEAMSSSCAVVLTDTGAEFAKDGKNCILVPINDTDMMVKAIDRLIKEQSLRMSICSEAYNTACRLSNPEQYIKNINKVIGELFDD
jgi:glycosyltransferase involved in cell wall biosynthesis